VIPLWAAPPSLGGKERDKSEVAEHFTRWRPRLICAPLAGFAKEWCALPYDAAQRIIVGDSDPAIRAYWRGAHEGQLVVSAEQARAAWPLTMSCARACGFNDPVQEAWKLLSQSETAAAESGCYAAWTIAVCSGGRTGGRRRSKKIGVWNWPYAPRSGPNKIRDPGWLTKRILSAERFEAADAWARGRIWRVVDDWRAALDAVGEWVEETDVEWSDVALSVDQPYGKCETQLYDMKWNHQQRDALAAHVLELVSRGCRAVVWCGVNDVELWRKVDPDARIRWRFRPARTTMKSGAGGTKNSEGGFMGISL